MQLGKKKELAARALGVGRNRVLFNSERLDEIKEIITKQDVKDLVNEKVITVKEKKGRSTKEKRKTRRRIGSIKRKVSKRKEEYMILTRKLRGFVKELKKKEILTFEECIQIRKEIRAKQFRSKAHLKERVNSMIKERA